MIQTSIHCEKKPNPLIFDSKGNVIALNKKVAYNHSGSVNIGYIKEIKKNFWKISRNGVEPNKWWTLQFEMIIMNVDGKLSTIKNPNSFVII